MGGVGWYRKHFTTPEGLTDGAVASLTFDGVYMHSEPYPNPNPNPNLNPNPNPNPNQACTCTASST